MAYAACKTENTYRLQAKKTLNDPDQLETLDSRIAFREEKSVEVEATDEQQAISLATAHLPEGCSISAQASRMNGRL